MEAVAHPRHPGNRCLAPGRVSHVLEAALPRAGTDGAKADPEGGARADLPHGCGEPNVGSTSHSWRTAYVRFRHLGTNHLPLDETSPEGP